MEKTFRWFFDNAEYLGRHRFSRVGKLVMYQVLLAYEVRCIV